MADKAHSGHAYRKAREACLKPDNLICCRCGEPILKGVYPPRHKLSPSADHYDLPASIHGVNYELKPAHYGCNSRHGNGTKGTAIVDPQQIREW